MGDLIPFLRRQRHSWPSAWAPYLQRRGFADPQIRVTLWAGLLFGLLLFHALRLWPAPYEPVEAAPSASLAPVDPYAESGRSRVILEGQEASVIRPADDPSRENMGVSGPVRVIDGDTFDYGGMRIRIADIDTPEVNGQCASEIALAARATRRMRVLLTQGPFELRSLSNGRDTDQYGRKLRVVTRGGQSLGDLLVAEGLARTWSGRREPWC